MKEELLNIIIYELLKKDDDKDTLYDVVHHIRPKRGKLLSLFTFSAFILVFLFYFQYNQLLALFVFLLFLFWYTRSDINIFSKRYKGTESQKVYCFTDAQNFILKGKFDKAKEVLDLYTNKYNDQAAMVLYNFCLFVLGEHRVFNNNLTYIDEYQNEAYLLLNGINKVLIDEDKEAIMILQSVEKVSEPLILIKLYFLASAYHNINDIKTSQEIYKDIIQKPSLELHIKKYAQEMLDRSDTI